MQVESTNKHLGLAVTHLNASVGAALTEGQLATALRAGSASAISDSPLAAALVDYLFVELDPRLIVLCAYEAGADVSLANQMYQDSLTRQMPTVPAWEESIQYML